MKKEDFFTKFADELEITSVELTSGTVLNEIDEYGSMLVMGIIAFVDEHFSSKITARQISTLTDINSLMILIGLEKFVD